ncbi:hypothetical protein, partial [Thiorhodococcus mannitoliphagus]|uniref:hypothetical protein n=1 Tax=Thiorhodococcus mannitoliphagus TaxID=329406 RepID=UPI00197E9079
RISVRFQLGMLSALTSDWCPVWIGIGVRIRPEYSAITAVGLLFPKSPKLLMRLRRAWDSSHVVA